MKHKCFLHKPLGFKMKNFLILVVISILFPLFASADTIVLKNGMRIENVRAWEEDGQVKCYRFGSLIGYLKKNVRKIEKGEVKKEINEANLLGNEARPDSDELYYLQKKQIDLQIKSLEKFEVIKVYDGDTFMAEGHSIKIMARLIGIDAPETANKRKQKPEQPYSQNAKKYLVKMILNKTVPIKSYGMGPYNRLLVEVFADHRNVNLELLRSGLAEAYNGKLPKGFNVSSYKKAEMKARKSRKGIWSLGNKYVSPEKWRKIYNK